MLRGEAVKLYGTDVHAEDFRAFYDFADLRYTQLQHHSLLPYEDNSFDAVIGTAVLEHVPNDSASLNEIYRVLRPGGVFVVTTLPNRFSYTEWLNRRLNRPHHHRRYSLREAKHLFLHHGFIPVAYGYHQVLPSMCSIGGVFNSRLLNGLVDVFTSHSGFAERIWPIRCFASNVFVVGIKVKGFDNADFNLGERLGRGTQT
jgi:SAM-dependent methyltransferase